MSLHAVTAPHPTQRASVEPQLLSIVLPAFNEQEALPLAYQRLSAMAGPFADLGLNYELIFVNDGSRDHTPAILDDLAQRDTHVRGVHLTRNFGHQAAISAGIDVARGDAVVLMDCDLQDPPEVLPQFIAKWREGYQVVFAVRRKRKEWFGKRFAYWAFYRLMALTAEMDIPLDSGDFCLMDRRAVDLLSGLPERQRFVRGLRTWVGLRQVGVEYDRGARVAGQPQYTFTKLVKLAMDGLISFSSAPLRLVTRMGMLCAALSIAFLVWVLIDGIFRITQFERGWPSLAAVVLFVGAVQLISLGIIGEYLSRIFLEVKGRPAYLIARIASSTDTAPPADQASSGRKNDSTNANQSAALR